MDKTLRKLGFRNHIGPVICRWELEDEIVDIMPSNGKIFGFVNSWYESGIKNSEKIQLSEDITINIFQLPYFLLCKLEAFKERGANDILCSKDFEDIITILDAQTSLENMIQTSSPINQNLAEGFHFLTAHRHYSDALQGAIVDDVNHERYHRLDSFLRSFS
jgi:hypothetical protein